MEQSPETKRPHQIYRAKRPVWPFVLAALAIHLAIVVSIVGVEFLKWRFETEQTIFEVEIIAFAPAPAEESVPMAPGGDPGPVVPPVEPPPPEPPPPPPHPPPPPPPPPPPEPEPPPPPPPEPEPVPEPEPEPPPPPAPEPVPEPVPDQISEPEPPPLTEPEPESEPSPPPPEPEPEPEPPPPPPPKPEPPPPKTTSAPRPAPAPRAAPAAQGGGGSTADSVAAKASTAASFDAAYLNNPPPRYPISAFRERAQGTVIVRAEVLPDGQSGQVLLHQSSGFKSLDDAAVATVKKWRFKPATNDGKPIKQWVNIPISFKLNQQ